MARFSIYTAIQCDVLIRLSKEIRGELDEALKVDGEVSAPHFERAYGLFWLWVLGAYEVVRTMTAARSCFTGEALNSIRAFKKDIAELRIPFAKQEYRGKHLPIRGEASVWGIEHRSKDLEFDVKDRTFSIRTLLGEFDVLVEGLSEEDVLRPHQAAYE